MQSVIHTGIVIATQRCGKYYDGQGVDEGKHKMTVINKVRNKLVNRIFACINNNRIYQKKKCLVETYKSEFL